MGDDAVGSVATPTQIDAMAALLRVRWRPAPWACRRRASYPSRWRWKPGAITLRPTTSCSRCAVVQEFPGTQLEAIVPGCLNGSSDDEMTLLASMSAAAQRPLNWNVLGIGDPESYKGQLVASDRARERGGRVVALTLPQGMSIRLTFLSGMVLDALPGWSELFGLPVGDRIAALRDPDTRRRLDEGAQSPDAGIIGALARWRNLTVIETFAPETAGFEGMRVGDIARATGKSEFDAVLDIVVADELRTGLSPTMPPASDDVWHVADAWRDDRTVVGASDAAAHLDMMCGAPTARSWWGGGSRS